MTISRLHRRLSALLVFTILLAISATADRAKPSVPKVWDDAIMASVELPLVEPAWSPKQISAEYYYKIPVRPIYRSFPVYRPDREPPGYLSSLVKRDPEIVWDGPSHHPKLASDADWLAAGEIVFDAPVGYDPRSILSADQSIFLRDPAWYERTGAPTTRDGILPA